MHMTKLRNVGGSVMMAVPRALLDVLQLKAGAEVGISVDGGKLVVQPARRKYTVDELLAGTDFTRTPEDELWLNGPAVGREVI